MAVTEYGTIGIRPMGTYDPDTKYDLLNLVEYDGSSYVAHTDPPLGSLPTNTAYWQVLAQGTGKATADSVGTVKPDGTTTEVSADCSLSVKTATQDALGVVKGSNGIKVGDDGSIDINTVFAQATELANIIAGEAVATALGKISKSIAVTMGLDQNALLKSMLTNMDVNDSTKINSAAYVHKLTERIGMGEELATGANLTAGLNAVNSNLAYKANSTDIASEYLGLTVKNTKIKLLIENFNFNNGVTYKSAIKLFGWKPTYLGALPQLVSLNSGLCFAAMSLDGDNVKISLQDTGYTFTGSAWITAILFANK
jgi:hypothetical protein